MADENKTDDDKQVQITNIIVCLPGAIVNPPLSTANINNITIPAPATIQNAMNWPHMALRSGQHPPNINVIPPNSNYAAANQSFANGLTFRMNNMEFQILPMQQYEQYEQMEDDIEEITDGVNDMYCMLAKLKNQCHMPQPRVPYACPTLDPYAKLNTYKNKNKKMNKVGIFAGVTCAFFNIISPDDLNPQRHPLWVLMSMHGAKPVRQLTAKVTHLIGAKHVTTTSPHKLFIIVHFRWAVESMRQAKRLNEEAYSIDGSKYKLYNGVAPTKQASDTINNNNNNNNNDINMKGTPLSTLNNINNIGGTIDSRIRKMRRDYRDRQTVDRMDLCETPKLKRISRQTQSDFDNNNNNTNNNNTNNNNTKQSTEYCDIKMLSDNAINDECFDTNENNNTKATKCNPRKRKQPLASHNMKKNKNNKSRIIVHSDDEDWLPPANKKRRLNKNEHIGRNKRKRKRKRKNTKKCDLTYNNNNNNSNSNINNSVKPPRLSCTPQNNSHRVSNNEKKKDTPKEQKIKVPGSEYIYSGWNMGGGDVIICRTDTAKENMRQRLRMEERMDQEQIDELNNGKKMTKIIKIKLPMNGKLNPNHFYAIPFVDIDRKMCNICLQEKNLLQKDIRGHVMNYQGYSKSGNTVSEICQYEFITNKSSVLRDGAIRITGIKCTMNECDFEFYNLNTEKAITLCYTHQRSIHKQKK